MPDGKKTKPLLYIYQPFARIPSTQMQDIYRNKMEKHLVQEEMEEAEVITPVLPVNEIKPVSTELNINITTGPAPALKHDGELKERVPSDETHDPGKRTSVVPNDEPEPSPFRKVKSFKEMNLQERLEYLVNFPKALPPVPCVFYTKDNNYQGYLHEYQNDAITIKFHDQTTRIIPFADLRDILMIGIRK